VVKEIGVVYKTVYRQGNLDIGGANYPDDIQYDVSKSGNSNRGHKFDGDGATIVNGVIGKLIPDDDRWALIEYLKSL